MEILKQGQFEPMPMEEQVASLLAVNEGYVDDVPLEQVRDFEKRLLTYLKDQHESLLQKIRESKALEDDTKEELKKGIEEFKQTYTR
ncbi:MAG: hypothetical protein A2748_00715 [Candidatus Wildermuthbacteria bacterium RIFCSPHIGHO2_01_FULL_45_20]|nr:MAG: hypothetical protein A2748_00715 [Candidatus Wildermuthbacteria bacterium RIFCSPHIGHO2_01_FULL_45_20]